MEFPCMNVRRISCKGCYSELACRCAGGEFELCEKEAQGQSLWFGVWWLVGDELGCVRTKNSSELLARRASGKFAADA